MTKRIKQIAAAVILTVLTAAGVTLADERKVIVSLGVGEEYNDNIFFNYDDELEDWINRLTGGLELADRTERADLALSARVVNNAYADHDELDGLDQHYTGRLGYRLTPDLRSSLNAAYMRDTQPDRDIDVTGLVLGNEQRDTYNVGADLQYALNEITSAGLSYRYSRQDYESNEYSDYTAHQGGLGLTRRLDRYWDNLTGRLNVDAAHFDYETNRTDYYAATIGALWAMTEVWHLQVDGGARYARTEFDYPGGTVSNEGWGGVGTLTFGYRGEYTTVDLTASHGIEPASGQGGSVERTYGELGLRYRFAQKAWVGATAGYYLNKAEAGDLAPFEMDKRTFNARSYLRFQVIDHLVLEASYTYTQIEDRVIDDTGVRNLALLKLTYAYPVLE